MRSIFLDELLSLHRGQGLELYWRDSLQCPTEEEYIAMVNDSCVIQFILNYTS
jgi:geranylgeranyl diphosphate synthase, type III